MNLDVIFHRGIQRVSAKYRGKQDFDRLPEELREQVYELHKEINEHLETDRLGVLTETGHPNLYFDFVECSEDNAVAFTSEEWAMVGVTTGVLTTAHQMMSRLSHDIPTLHCLGFRDVDEDQAMIHGLLRVLLFRFVTAHEFGHHAKGHLGIASASDGFQMREEIAPFPVGDKIEQHVLELEADAYAVENIVRPTLRRGKIHRWLVSKTFGVEEDKPELDQRYASALLIAVASYFQSIPQPGFTGETVREVLTHPPRLVRLRYITDTIRAMVSRGEPQLLSWLDASIFHRLCSRALVKGKPPGMSLEQQEEFVESEAGRAYMQCLDDARAGITAKYERFAWKPNFAPIFWQRSSS
jgi:hypothetical protein